ncbi:MAG: UvrD-helicase domain-containing protein [Spirochaetes bacterium]|nr:UvrD-helicase domain-containing protein [Spirochaetota bacterium]
MEKRPPYLEKLNAPQYEAVVHEGSPLLILAGAGSGKTNAITNKIAWLIDKKGADPASILAVTFTNKAAKEMEERVSAILRDYTDTILRAPPMIRTFHSFGAWVLRRNGAPVNLSPNYTIHDDEDMLTLIHSAWGGGERKKDLKPYANMISRAKDYCLSYNDNLTPISLDPLFPDIYKEYQQKLDSTDGADFGDLIMKTWILLRDNAAIRERLQQRFKIILVDEYQDSNAAQFELLKLLAGSGENLTVVGDDDQSIYRFRGAEVKNILTFPEVFKNTKVIKLEQNYRSASNILDIASAVVANNRERLGKKLWTEKAAVNKSIVAVLETEKDEARFCADVLADGNYSNTAILYRTNAQSREFELYFSKLKIPYKIVGALRFFEREEVKDILAYLALLINPKNEAAFRRIANKPVRGIGKAGLEKIVKAAAGLGGDLLKACNAADKEASGKAAKGLQDFSRILEELKACFGKERNAAVREVNLSAFVKKCASVTGLAAYYREQDKAGDTQKLLNIEGLVNHAADFPYSFEGLISFIENTELDRTSSGSEKESPTGVTLITMHNTKGLEFDRVIITGLEEGLFPGFRSNESNEDIEEERRIFYVSITRARKELYMTFCRSRMIWGKTHNFIKPSRFLSEIPEDLVVLENLCSSAGGGWANADERMFPGLHRTSPSGNSSRSSAYKRSLSGEGQEFARPVRASSSENPGELAEGDLVYCKKYGKGQIVKKWSSKAEGAIAVVIFEDGRTAKFLLDYANLEKIKNVY